MMNLSTLSRRVKTLTDNEEILMNIQNCESFDEVYQKIKVWDSQITEEEATEMLLYLHKNDTLLNEIDLESLAGGSEITTIKISLK